MNLNKSMKGLAALMLLMASNVCAIAQKSLYIPNEWKDNTSLYMESDPNNQATWSKSRSKESDNVIVYWENGYGKTNPSNASEDYKVDIDDLLAKCETFYAMNVNTLGFHAGNHDKYKIMVLMIHTTDWVCAGAGYDFVISALWLSPSTCKPVGSAVAHEVGHSFHYMAYGSDSNYGATSGIETGFHSNWTGSNGQAIWEQTAQWQSFQSYPEQMFTDAGSWDYFSQASNYAYSHEWLRYQNYWFHYYLCEKYNDIKTISQIWKQRETTPKDFCQVLMDNKNLSVDQFYQVYFDYAMHIATLDIDALKNNGGNSKIGTIQSRLVSLGSKKYQVAYSSAPQSTGFNVIQLSVPKAGTTVTTKFTALNTGSSLASGDPCTYFNGEGDFASANKTTYNTATNSIRGFRVGYVALKTDGTREYYSTGNRIGTTSSASVDVKCTVPANTKELYLVVVPSLSSYVRHDWDEDYTDDDQWPYTVEFTNTNIAGEGTIDGREIGNITFNYDITFPAASDYSGTTVTLSSEAKAKLTTAFQMDWSDISDNMETYSTSGPSAGKVMFYAANADGSLQASASTANGYGHWFNSNGAVVSWGSNSVVYSEFNPSTLTYTIGQMPSANTTGDKRTIRQALRYKDPNGNEAIAYFNFNITFAETTSVILTSIEYDDDTADEEDTDTQEYSYNVSLPVTKTEYSTNTTVNVKENLLTALGLTETEFANAFVSPTETLTDGQVMLYGVNVDGSLYKTGYTANNGYWFGSDQNVSGWSWGTESYFAEGFTADTYTFNIGQMPNTVTAGTEKSLKVAFVYQSGNVTKTVYITFNLTFTEMPSVIFYDTETSRTFEGGTYNVTLSRSFAKDKWLTFCTPFNIYSGEWSTYGITSAKQLTGISHNGESVDLEFTDATDNTIWVGIPYIIKVNQDLQSITKETFVLQPADCSASVSDDAYTCTMHGNATKTTLPKGAYYISDNKFYYTTKDTNTMKGFRAYFTLSDASGAVKTFDLSLDLDDNLADGILRLEGDKISIPSHVDVYSPSGILIRTANDAQSATQGLPKGMYIVNGTKTLVK